MHTTCWRLGYTRTYSSTIFLKQASVVVVIGAFPEMSPFSSLDFLSHPYVPFFAARGKLGKDGFSSARDLCALTDDCAIPSRQWNLYVSQISVRCWDDCELTSDFWSVRKASL